ncbi:MAG: hypothetical protein AAF799_12950 [Myxococcota bacterium]
MNAIVALIVSNLLVVSPSVEVTVDAQIADGALLGDRLESDVARTLSERSPEGPAAGPVAIHIGGELLGFRVQVDFAGRRTITECPCTHGELVAHVRHRVVEAIETPPPVRPRAPLPACPAVRPAAAPPPVAPPSGLSPRGRAGVGSLVAGALAIGAGGGFWLGMAAVRTELAPSRFDGRPPAIAALAVGTAAVVTGVALLVSERRARRRASRTTR